MALLLEINIQLHPHTPDDVIEELQVLFGMIDKRIDQPDHRFFMYFDEPWRNSLPGASVRRYGSKPYNIRYRGMCNWREQDADRFMDWIQQWVTPCGDTRGTIMRFQDLDRVTSGGSHCRFFVRYWNTVLGFGRKTHEGIMPTTPAKRRALL